MHWGCFIACENTLFVCILKGSFKDGKSLVKRSFIPHRYLPLWLRFSHQFSNVLNRQPTTKINESSIIKSWSKKFPKLEKEIKAIGETLSNFV